MTYHDLRWSLGGHYGPDKLSATPIADRRGNVWISARDPRNTDEQGWLNLGVTRRPGPKMRRVHHRLARRLAQHQAWPCRDSGDEYHSSDKISKLPGSVNPGKH